MKKIIVLTLVFACIFMLFVMSVGGRSMGPRASRWASVEKKSLQNFGGRADDGYADNAPAPMEVASPSAAPPPPPRSAVMGKKEAVGRGVAEKGLLKVLGSAGAQGEVADVLSGGGLGAAAAGKMGKGGKDVGGELAPAATRAWFPETFLFEPLVVTDEHGHANVPVKVPDRLTTWRVLALAHSRAGGQAGTTASFLGTLPTYVEPVTPHSLFAGDTVRLPIQVVNTTDAEVSSPLRFFATGATLAATGGTVKVPAEGSVVQYVSLSTSRPGTATVKAVLGDTDAVERTIDVTPAGKREVVNHAGSLGATRTFDIEGPEGSLPGSESVRLQVFPGALGFMRNELAAAPGRGGVAEDAYLLQLLGSAPQVLKSLGSEANPAVIRDLTLLATQRVMRHARAPSVDAATMLTEAALGHPESPVLSRLGERLAMQVEKGQRPDGTCQGEKGWTLQRLMVTTAECVRAVRAAGDVSKVARQRALGVTIKASGAFERNLARITDGYTAAAIVASGGVTGEVETKLKALIVANLADGADGAKYLKVDGDMVRADGQTPSTYEATALAILALEKEPKAPLAELGTHLLGGYNPWSGWGDGRTNLVAVRAVTHLFKDPLPSQVKLTLERDGVPMAEGTLSADKLKDVARLEADATGSIGHHTWTVKAEPPVPGLGYSWSLTAYTPWKDEPGGGLELTTEVPSASVGQASDVLVTVAAPAGVNTVLRASLPAGVQPDTTSLQALVSAGQVVRYETEEGAVTLHLPSLKPGASWQAKLKVIPTLAGTLQSGPWSLAPEGRPASGKSFALKRWTVK